jgi:hypothetical protein
MRIITLIKIVCQGAHAIFAVTNFWEHLFTGKTQDESGEAEQRQALNLAHAAAKCTTLEHYVWSTLQSAKKRSNGKFLVPHFDYKAEVDEFIRKSLPQLAAKTTYLYVSYYPSNMAFFPIVTPFEVVSSPLRIFILHLYLSTYANIVINLSHSLAPTANTSNCCVGMLPHPCPLLEI